VPEPPLLARGVGVGGRVVAHVGVERHDLHQLQRVLPAAHAGHQDQALVDGVRLQEAPVSRVIGSRAEVVELADGIELPAGEEDIVGQPRHLSPQLAEGPVLVAVAHCADLIDDLAGGAQRVLQEEGRVERGRVDAGQRLVDLLAEEVGRLQRRQGGIGQAVLGGHIRAVIYVGCIASRAGRQDLVAQTVVQRRLLHAVEGVLIAHQPPLAVVLEVLVYRLSWRLHQGAVPVNQVASRVVQVEQTVNGHAAQVLGHL
jgi:hypothetical protein